MAFGCFTLGGYRKFLAAGIIAGSLLAGGCAAVPPADNNLAVQQVLAEPLDAKAWTFNHSPGIVISTEHYQIYTTVKDPLYQRLLAKILEATYDRAQLFQPTERIKKQMECYVFADRNQWELYTRMRAGSNAPIYLQISAGGYCQEGVFAGYDIGRNRTLSVIAHEAWHQYSWFTFKDRLPSWLEEGLATQNESLRWEGATPKFAPDLNYDRFSALQQANQRGMLLPFSDLTSTHAGQVVKDPERAKAYYAQVWSLTLFLEHSPKYRQGLLKILDDARDGNLVKHLKGSGVTQGEITGFTERWNQVAGPRYMKAYFNPNIEELEAEYRAFVRDFTSAWPPKLPAQN